MTLSTYRCYTNNLIYLPIYLHHALTHPQKHLVFSTPVAGTSGDCWRDPKRQSSFEQCLKQELARCKLVPSALAWRHRSPTQCKKLSHSRVSNVFLGRSSHHVDNELTDWRQWVEHSCRHHYMEVHWYTMHRTNDCSKCNVLNTLNNAHDWFSFNCNFWLNEVYKCLYYHLLLSLAVEWCGAQPDGLCLPLLIIPCTIKSRSSVLAPAHLGGPGKRAVKRLWWCGGCVGITTTVFSHCTGQPVFAGTFTCRWQLAYSDKEEYTSSLNDVTYTMTSISYTIYKAIIFLQSQWGSQDMQTWPKFLCFAAKCQEFDYLYTLASK